MNEEVLGSMLCLFSRSLLWLGKMEKVKLCQRHR